MRAKATKAKLHSRESGVPVARPVHAIAIARPSMGKRPKLDRHAHQLPVDAVAAASPAANDACHSELRSPQRPHLAMAPGPLLCMDTMSGPSAMEVERPEEAPDAAAAAAVASNAANASLNPVGMQIYWNLSSLDMAVREAAALALVRELRAKQEEFAAGGGRGDVAEVLGAKENDVMLEGCAPAVQYALRRLVRGLGSSRECARQGFATALTAVVEAVPVLRGEALLRIIPSNLEVTSSMKKQDARDGLLGRLFAYGSLVRAKRLIGNGTSSEEKELAKEIVEQLFTLAKQKTFLREPAVNLVIELASRLPSSAVRETVCAAPLFDEWLRRDVESQSPEALLLALQLKDLLPAQSSPLLPESGNFQDLFEPSHLAKLVPCLKESSSSHPRVHSVWHLLLDLLLAPPTSPIQESAKKKRAKSGGSKDAKDIKRIEENLANFWSIVVDGALLSSSHERKNLAMELLLLVLPRLPNPESVGIVLSNILVRCVLDILSSKDSHLHKSAQRCLSELRLWAESSNLRQVAVIVGLQKNSYGKFDTLSKTSTVKALANGLTTEDGVLAFVHNLEELFLASESAVVKVSEELVEGSEDAVMNGHDKPGANDRIWIVEQMCALCRQVKLELKTAQASLYRAVIKFLVTHSVFEASKQQNSGVAEENGFRWPQKPLAVNIRKLCVDRLHSILVDAAQFVFSQKSKRNKTGASGVSEAVTDDEDFSLFAALYCLKVQESPDSSLVQPFKEEAAESVKILQQTVATLSTTVKSETNVDRIRRLLALRTLLSHLLLESFLEPGSTDDIAAELVICCSKAFPDLRELSKITPSVEVEDESDEVPPVMDVLLDVLLSLLAKGSTPVRLAAEKVFKVYCEDLTTAGMTDVLRIINEGSKSGRHKSMIEDGEDDDDDDILEDDEDEEADGDVGKAEEIEGAKDAGEGDDEDADDDEDVKDGVDVGMGDGESRTLQQQMRFKRTGEELDDEAEGSDSDSDVSDMDDEAMFRADQLLANVLKHRKEASKTNSQTELAHFKFRVLSLLEYFLQKRPGSSLVLLAVQGLVKAFVSAINQLGTAPEENEVLIKRLENMLQSKVLKVKKYPRDKDVDLALTRKLLMQTWKLASRSSIKRVRKLAQACTLWTLKVLLGNEENGDDEFWEFLASSLDEYFTRKKSRLPGTFLSEVFQRHPMLGRSSFGRLISRCGDGRTEFMKCEAMRLITGILKPVSSGKGKKRAPEGEDHKQLAKTFEEHMVSLGTAILSAVQRAPQKSDYKVITLLFCSSCIDAFTVLYPQKPLHTLLDTGALLAGLKAIEAPSKGRLHNLLTKLVGTVTVELEKNPVSSDTVIADDTKTSTSKKKKAMKSETSTLSETPSKRKKARDEVAPMEVQVEELPPMDAQVEETPSKKKQQQKSAKKVKVSKGSS